MEKKVQFISMPLLLLLLLEWTAAGPSVRGPIRTSTSFFYIRIIIGERRAHLTKLTILRV